MSAAEKKQQEAKVKATRLSPGADDGVSARAHSQQREPSFSDDQPCCTRIMCAKYGLFVINFLVWVAGGVMMGVGTWSRLQRTSLAAFDHVTVDVAYLLIGIGAIMFVVSLFGCMGALRNNTCLLKMFIFAVVLVFVAQLVAGVLAFVLLDTVEGKMLDFLRSAITNFNDGNQEDVDNAINHLQETYYCCGGASYQDWEANMQYNCSTTTSPASCSVPVSCCLQPAPDCAKKSRQYTESYAERTIYTRGCIGALMSVFKDNLVIIGIIAFVVGFLQICSLLLANCLLSYLVMEMKLSL